LELRGAAELLLLVLHRVLQRAADREDLTPGVGEDIIFTAVPAERERADL